MAWTTFPHPDDAYVYTAATLNELATELSTRHGITATPIAMATT